MALYQSVWALRWKRLHEAGLTFQQAQVVADLLDECHAFGTATLSEAARKRMDTEWYRCVYADLDAASGVCRNCGQQFADTDDAEHHYESQLEGSVRS